MLLALTVASVIGFAQAPARPAPGPESAGGFVAYPPRAIADPAAVERGKALYSVNCTFCHGADARGGDGGGPNLIRSQVVLDDDHGERLTAIVQKGRPDAGMPAFAALSVAQVGDVAAFLHSIPVSSRSGPPSIDIVVGDANAGRAYFQSKCASCHSVTGDLQGIASKVRDPRMLQQTWLMPGSGGGRGATAPPPVSVKPATATVTLPSGEKVEGTLSRLDDFVVSVTETDGTHRSFALDVANPPTFEIHDPLKPHKDLLRTYTDTDIHNVTAYLVTVK
jgi:mono/diheme cytochrome c family protein